MRKPLSRRERDDCGIAQTSIDERAFVKRGWCRFCVAGSIAARLSVTME
jgi:hypothetical protein